MVEIGEVLTQGSSWGEGFRGFRGVGGAFGGTEVLALVDPRNGDVTVATGKNLHMTATWLTSKG